MNAGEISSVYSDSNKERHGAQNGCKSITPNDILKTIFFHYGYGLLIFKCKKIGRLNITGDICTYM